MQFLNWQLGHRQGREVVEVKLRGVESDVLLMDTANFDAFRGGRSFEYVGGHYDRSPVRLQIPRPGTWVAVVVPSPGPAVEASVRVLAA
jgi:hypothetical protein